MIFLINMRLPMISENSNNVLPEIGFVRLPMILTIFPVGRSTWWQGVKNGKYPKPIKISERAVAWRVDDIKSLINDYDNKRK